MNIQYCIFSHCLYYVEIPSCECSVRDRGQNSHAVYEFGVFQFLI